ncbi:MAG: hypothetical protein AVDCRST_MAG49-1593 [uncultured Thermomicrobiales bacterium]|uniref:Membrane protein 6-pyruvoyl-tetrahydropterin synthase-related domain-containing protein n=1 Tax=uncultured Thermomicrobiales bacterium TaxID=1645740 RepID=A0A6J4UGG1_9BACT|nr:MAG: hypothetical protein AVDCRST_MAG49-1593 [uncultured Thermomicrobiales bacterium]
MSERPAGGASVPGEPDDVGGSDADASARRSVRRDHGLGPVLWPALMGALALWVAVRLGAFDLWSTVTLGDGRTASLVQTFGNVDHPFHVARAETLRRALADGQPLRWVGHHQGGYPVEFYPPGVAWLEVGVWALALGALPIAAAHKLVVIGLFLLPGLAYVGLAWRDRLGLGVAATAFAAHVAVPGGQYGGGYHELVGWGLVTNVAGSIAALFVLLWLTDYLARGARAAAAGAALAAAFALVTNPRSGVALAVIGIGAVLAMATAAGDDRVPIGTLVRRVALVGALAGLLAAPELVSLLRFQHLYDFLRYESYADLGAYLHESRVATTLPVLVLGAAGVVLGLTLRGRPLTRAAAVTLVLYVAATVVLSGGGEGGGPLRQLETVRLMPFQRLLVIYLAAVAFAAGARTVLSGMPGRWPWRDLAQAAAVAGILVALVFRPPAGTPEEERGLFPVLGSATGSRAALDAALAAADRAAAPGTALYVVGSTPPYWHEQLWAPLVTRRPLRYDNWLWHWHFRQKAPGFDEREGHNYTQQTVPETFEADFLADQGIGAVVVTGRAAKRAAAASAALQPLTSGPFDAYAVRAPTPLVTLGGGSISGTEVDAGRIEATGTGTGGEVRVRANWFPRWEATVNGEPVAVARTDDGFMAVQAPPGQVEVVLTYTVDRVDWLARAMTVAGLLLTLALLVPLRRRWVPRGRRAG